MLQHREDCDGTVWVERRYAHPPIMGGWAEHQELAAFIVRCECGVIEEDVELWEVEVILQHQYQERQDESVA